MRYTIEDMKALAIQRRGLCLSDSYDPYLLKWECSEGHVWEARPDSVRQGCWCKRCKDQRSKLSLQDMRNFALKRGGECLSTVYVNARSRLTWKCSDGHTWSAIPSSIDQGSWCPYCANKKWFNEEKCRYIFESITKRKFKKTRIGRLELDGFNKELGLAFEHNGVQHYQDNIFQQGLLEKVQKRDSKKHEYCIRQDINLVVIPYWESAKGDQPLVSFIAKALNKKVDICFKEFYKTYCSSLKELKDIAIQHGGMLLSDEYLGDKKHLLWQCEWGHTWRATPNKIKQGRWCHSCRYKRMWQTRFRYTIEIMEEWARQNGGECVSTKCLGSQKKLTWKCSEGHVWKTTPQNIKQGRWCLKCKKLRTKLLKIN